MTFARFTLAVAVSLAAFRLAAAAALEADAARAAGLGALIAGLNAVAAYGLVLWSEGRSNLAFMQAVLGGLTLRLFLMLAAVVIALRVFEISQLPFVVSLLGHFVVFLVAELWLVHRRPTPVKATS